MEYGKNFEATEKSRLHPSAFNVALETFEGYVDYWSKRPTTEVLAIEYPFEPRLLAPNAPEWAKRTARVDSIERWRGKTWIGEAKSTSSAPGRVADTYALHGQILLQMTLWGDDETERFGPLAGVLLDVMVKPQGKKPARGSERIPIELKDCEQALKWFRKDFVTWQMQTAMIDWNATVERRLVCQRNYGPCEFRPLCLRGRAGSMRYALPDGSKLHEWKPSPGKEVPPWE